MKMKKIFTLLVTGALGVAFLTTSALAEEKYEHADKHQPFGLEVTGDIGVFSKYVWRGVMYTKGKPAVQGDMGVGLGDFSASVWFSNDYESPAPQFAGRDTTEFDWTLDYSGSTGDIGYSMGGIYYTYLYDGASNFVEVYAGMSYDALISPSLSVYYSAKGVSSGYYKTGDIWVDIGLSTSVDGVDLSGTVSYVNWKNKNTRAFSADNYKNGFNLVALTLSKDIPVADVIITPSLSVTIPIIGKSADGERHIYGEVVKNEFVAAVNIAF